MIFNKLIPELSVSNFQESLYFYTAILGFKIEYQREETNFAFLSFQGSQIMISSGNEAQDSAWYTGALNYPRGRGIHFQFEVERIAPLLERLRENGYPIKGNPEEFWFRKDDALLGLKGFLVMDPDGYLLMFNEDIGTKPI
jgi:catechol 2,3-dioxygenase-like lactoylglutathione lyase family enzyme